ncbi:unnamed protein product [Porites evermanni]|uniref:Secreted protein n=1 Tax=Porites evermanni TaxID=104178 RepID=A0ABN8SXP2_9CNID|nr:unnamed protein product [Porites evermanni]
MLSAKLSRHLMPVVFVMTTARLTRNLCVHLTRQHSRTSASVCWTFANTKVITPSTIQAAVQVCVTAAGRNDRFIKEFATVDWMAYQGAPDGGVAGKTRISEWWTGTQCSKVNLPQANKRYVFLK